MWGSCGSWLIHQGLLRGEWWFFVGILRRKRSGFTSMNFNLNGTCLKEVCSFPSFMISHGFSWHLDIHIVFVATSYEGLFCSYVLCSWESLVTHIFRNWLKLILYYFGILFIYVWAFQRILRYIPSKIAWDLTNGPRSVSCDRAIRYSGFFRVRETWVLLEISWIHVHVALNGICI